MRFVAILIVVVLAVALGFAVLSPGDKPEKEGDTYYYYPRVNIYYDVEQERYVFLDSSNNQWKRAKSVEESVANKLKDYIIINNPPKPVWKENRQHKMVYGTALYASEEAIRQKYLEDSLRGVVRPVPPPLKEKPKADTEKKKKSGIERFFEELFGKKDKEDKQEL